MKIGVNGRFFAAPTTGVQRFGRELLPRLAARADVTLLLPRGVDAPTVVGLTGVRIGRLAGQLWEQVELPRAARRAALDVILHPANAAPRWGGPHVVVLHDVMPLTRPEDYSGAYRAWVRVTHVGAARRAAAVATVSQWSADEIAARTGLVRAGITVVRQGVAPLDAPSSRPHVDEVLARHGIDRPYCIAVVGADPRKGGDFLQTVWRGAGVGTPAATLVLVGGTASRVHGRAAGDAARVDGRVRQLGRVSDTDLAALYTGSLAVLHPAEAEGFGRPPLEALACGTRAVVAAYGPAREVLGAHADVVPLEAGAWRRAVDGLLAEPVESRRARVEAGLRHAARFRWEDTAAQLLELCREVAGCRP